MSEVTLTAHRCDYPGCDAEVSDDRYGVLPDGWTLIRTDCGAPSLSGARRQFETRDWHFCSLDHAARWLVLRRSKLRQADAEHKRRMLQRVGL